MALTPQSLAAARHADASKVPVPIDAIPETQDPGNGPVQGEEISIKDYKTLALILSITWGAASQVVLTPRSFVRFGANGGANIWSQLLKLTDAGSGVDEGDPHTIVLTQARLGDGVFELPFLQVGNDMGLRIDYQFTGADAATIIRLEARGGF